MVCTAESGTGHCDAQVPSEMVPAESNGPLQTETKDEEGDEGSDQKLLKTNEKTADGGGRNDDDENDLMDWSVVTYAAKPQLFRPRSRSSSSQILAQRQRTPVNGKLPGVLPENGSFGNGSVSKPTDANDEYDLQPPDGAWGWMVLLGTVIVNTLIPGLIKSFGVLFVEFIAVFNATPSSVAWIPALTFALYNLLGKATKKKLDYHSTFHAPSLMFPSFTYGRESSASEP